MRQLRVFGDPTGQVFGQVMSDNINHRVLAANTMETETPPAGAKFVVITASTAGYVRPNANAAVPAADVTSGAGGHYLPAGVPRMFSLSDVTDLRVIAAAISIITFEYYGL